MRNEQDTPAVRHVDTPSGRIGYVEVGSGPVALFVHGVLLNKHMWRYQLGALSDFRRCIAVDLLAHGDTEIAAAQDATSSVPTIWSVSSAHSTISTLWPSSPN